MVNKKSICLVILKTEDDGKTWSPVLPDDIPDFIGTNEVLTELKKGHYCKHIDDDKTWYRGELFEDQLDIIEDANDCANG